MRLPSLLLIACASSVIASTGCASTPSLTVNAVGPDPSARSVSDASGYLKVFTATHRVDVDFEAYFSPHAGYRVEDGSGRTVRFVPNHTSDQDEAPDIVGLSPGAYTIVAESTWYGLVSVPVVIAQGKTTVVHLDGHWRGGAGNTALVHLPDGESVGWSASLQRP